MLWIWQQPDWPNFRYAARNLRDRSVAVHHGAARLAGQLQPLSADTRYEATIALMQSEAVSTSAIEGETLDQDCVRSSLLSLMASDTIPENTDQKSAGAACLLIDVRKNWNLPLSDDLLGKWQSMAVPDQRYKLVMRGAYRHDPSPMQIVSGPYGKPTVHYEAPPSSDVPAQMSQFIDWYNESSPKEGEGEGLGQDPLAGLIRAGIAHLWFEVIHPFDDGNGRVGRAIADHALSQSLGYPTTACLATAIAADRKSYYAALERASRSSLDINAWLDYFADRVIRAQEIAKEEVDFVLAKARFYEAFGQQLNERQAKMIARVFAEGRQGFKGGISTKKYETITKCPNRTASRDLSDLLAKGIIRALPGGGRTTRYALTVVGRSASLL